jgi:hypothetical protein
MRIKRRLPVIFAVLLVAAAVALIVFLRMHAPPEPARLLPGADAFVYINLQWMRQADVAGKLPPVPHDPEYEQFIQETGFQFERDLDQAAFAIHYPAHAPGISRERQRPRFSEVFVAKIHGDRLDAYLRKISSSVENYRSVNIYNIPLEGRTLRVAIIGVDTVAASNHDDPLVIRGIVDRSRKLASPFGGPALLRQYYKHVPLASLGWGIFRVEPAENEISLGDTGLSFLFAKPAVVVGSVRYLGTVDFRLAAFTSSEQDAQLLTERVSSFLAVFHTAETSVSPPQAGDADIKQFLDSLKVEQHGDRAVLTATVPTSLLRKAIAESPSQLAPAAPEPQPPPPAKAPPQRKHHKIKPSRSPEKNL